MYMYVMEAMSYVYDAGEFVDFYFFVVVCVCVHVGICVAGICGGCRVDIQCC